MEWILADEKGNKIFVGKFLEIAKLSIGQFGVTIRPALDHNEQPGLKIWDSKAPLNLK